MPTGSVYYFVSSISLLQVAFVAFWGYRHAACSPSAGEAIGQSKHCVVKAASCAHSAMPGLDSHMA